MMKISDFPQHVQKQIRKQLALQSKERAQEREVKGMNKTEIRYELYLKSLVFTGKVYDYRFEAMKLRLADNTFYTPDFMVISKDGIELHEVKGYWHEDARVKTKVAAKQFPWFRFVGAQHKKGKWVFEEF